LTPGGGPSLTSITGADFDDDGTVDLVLTDANNGDATDTTGIFRYLGEGDGNFGAANSFGTGDRAPQAAVAGLFTGEPASADVVVVHKGPPPTLGYLPGQGTRSFGTPVTSESPSGAFGVTLRRSASTGRPAAR
jgi:hypothetical protein